MTSESRVRTREQICDVATQILADEGLEAVSMREIGRRLGVTAMMIYNYFPSLEALLVELRSRALAELAHAFVMAGRHASGPRERLLAMGRAYVEFAIAHPERYRLSHDVGLGSLGQRGLQGLTPSWDLLLAAVRERLGETGGCADPLTLASIIWSSLHGLASLHLAGRLHFGRDVSALTEPLLSALVDAVARAGPVDDGLEGMGPRLAGGTGPCGPS